ncbi:response regulator transcription factor [Corynebacterium sp. H127]|uniref:response regulator transcription factor n=1 Tax=Corynebacterium sp. H127 TaxID=3133418 RepID=UPI00309910D1
MIKVMIVDDDALVVAGIKSMLAEEADLCIVATAPNGQQAIECLRTIEVDVILMDLRMPVMNGTAATTKIKQGPNPPRVLALTTWNTDDHLRDALNAGVDGFLLKDASTAELANAIRQTSHGRSTLSPAVTDRLIAAFTKTSAEQQTAKRALAQLTPLEKEVADAIADGLTNADIAAERYMSVGNVKGCVSRILTKLGLSNRVQIATLVHQAQ